MTTHASRDTTTGLQFEEKAQIKRDGIKVAKHDLYRFLTKQNIDYTTFLSRKLLPDDAYIDYSTSSLYVYEKKYQETEGSADEKPQTCGFKIYQYKKIAAALGLKNTYYIYVFNNWFKKPKYKDMLDYINTVDGCSYYFLEE